MAHLLTEHLDSVGDVLEAVEKRLLQSGDAPVVVGIVGAPAVGKTYAAQRFADLLERRSIAVSVIAMDGFHISNRQLARIGLAERKGAPETFDTAGLIALLDRLTTARTGVVYAPDYDRELHEPVAARIAVPTDVQVVVVEGNYLLLEGEHWTAAARKLDISWYLDALDEVRTERLVSRQIAGGRSLEDAERWVRTVDQPNAELIERTRERADFATDALALESEILKVG